MIAYLFSLLANLFQFILGIQTQNCFPPPLSKQEEAQCFALAKKGDEKAREKLILHNLRLVSHIVRKYYANSKNSEDLVSIGTIGLIKSVDSFDISNGARFATYASKCIQNEILMYFRAQKKSNMEISINDTIDIDRDGNPLTYMDVLSSDECVPDDIDKKIQIEKALKFVNAVLTSRERQIIIMRYGLYGTKALTQKDVASKLKISRSYVSRLEKSALEKLASAFKKKKPSL